MSPLKARWHLFRFQHLGWLPWCGAPGCWKRRHHAWQACPEHVQKALKALFENGDEP